MAYLNKGGRLTSVSGGVSWMARRLQVSLEARGECFFACTPVLIFEMKVCEHLNKLDVEHLLDRLNSMFMADEEAEESELFGLRSSEESWFCLEVSRP